MTDVTVSQMLHSFQSTKSHLSQCSNRVVPEPSARRYISLARFRSCHFSSRINPRKFADDWTPCDYSIPRVASKYLHSVAWTGPFSLCGASNAPFNIYGCRLSSSPRPHLDHHYIISQCGLLLPTPPQQHLPTEIPLQSAKMSLANKLGISDVDVKGKRVLIRVSFPKAMEGHLLTTAG